MSCTADCDRDKWQTHPLVREGTPTATNSQMSGSNKNLVLGPRWGLTSGLTGRLTVSRNLPLTLTV
jgi:hypothetical protein